VNTADAQLVASVTAVISTVVLLIQFWRLVRATLPSFWLAGDRGDRDPMAPSLTVINCGGTSCYRLTAHELGSRLGLVEIADWLAPQGRGDFTLRLRQSTSGGVLERVVKRGFAKRLGCRQEYVRFIRIAGLRSNGRKVGRVFAMRSVGTSTPHCTPVRDLNGILLNVILR
jgi:hypothetical protein